MPLDFFTFGSGIVSANPVRFPFAALRALACAAALLFGTVPAWASCPEPRLTPPEQVVLKADTALIVVHATSAHDARQRQQTRVDEAVRFAKGRGIPVVYLVDETPIEHYFMEDRAPDHWVRSQGGELLKVTPRHVPATLSAVTSSCASAMPPTRSSTSGRSARPASTGSPTGWTASIPMAK